MRKSSDAYRRRLAARLKELLDERGLTVAAVERRLGRSRGYLGDALRGQKRLSVETLVEVLGVVGVEPDRFFAWPREAALAGEVRERAGEAGPGPRLQSLARSSPDPAVRELAALLASLLRALEARGLVQAAELDKPSP